MPRNNNKPYKKPPRVKDGTQISVYANTDLLKKIDTQRETESRSRGNMVAEICRQYFAAREAT